MNPAPPMTDDLEDLVRRARGGDRESYDRLFAGAADRLLLFVRLRLGSGLASRLEPSDVLQDVYLAAHESFASFEVRGEQSFLRWLCGIARHRLLALAEHHGAAPRRADCEATAISRVLELAHDDRTGPLSAAARVEGRERLAVAIEGLEDGAREALLLRFFEGLDQARIAERLGRSTSAVQRLLTKALAAVGGALEGEVGA